MIPRPGARKACPHAVACRSERKEKHHAACLARRSPARLLDDSIPSFRPATASTAAGLATQQIRFASHVRAYGIRDLATSAPMIPVCPCLSSRLRWLGSLDAGMLWAFVTLVLLGELMVVASTQNDTLLGKVTNYRGRTQDLGQKLPSTKCSSKCASWRSVPPQSASWPDVRSRRQRIPEHGMVSPRFSCHARHTQRHTE